MSDVHPLVVYAVMLAVVVAGIAVMILLAKQGEEDETIDVDKLDALLSERMHYVIDEAGELPAGYIDRALGSAARSVEAGTSADWESAARSVKVGTNAHWENAASAHVPIQSDDPASDQRVADQGGVDAASGGGETMRGRRTGMLY